ncbi:hypothetical protein L7F22_051816 [Adiantum nelumboides]|nr:hypothetical protein [Adiantum nelumboides]
MASSAIKASPFMSRVNKATFMATNKGLAILEEEMHAWRKKMDKWRTKKAAILEEKDMMRQEISILKAEVASLQDRTSCKGEIVEVKEAMKEELTKAVTEAIEIKTKAMADSIEGKMDAKEEGWMECYKEFDQNAYGELGKPLCAPNLWPEKPYDFKAVMEEYIQKMQDLAQKILKGIALALGGPADAFESTKAGDPFWVMRVIGYPPIVNHVETVSFDDSGISWKGTWGPCLCIPFEEHLLEVLVPSFTLL